MKKKNTNSLLLLGFGVGALAIIMAKKTPTVSGIGKVKQSLDEKQLTETLEVRYRNVCDAMRSITNQTKKAVQQKDVKKAISLQKEYRALDLEGSLLEKEIELLQTNII